MTPWTVEHLVQWAEDARGMPPTTSESRREPSAKAGELTLADLGPEDGASGLYERERAQAEFNEIALKVRDALVRLPLK